MTVAAGARSSSPRAARDVGKEFEAFVLQSFIQEMLPKGADDVYGTGIAGDIWRSMLSEQLASEVAERGGIGIAEEVRAGQALKNLPMPGTTAAPLPQNQAGPETPAGGVGSGWRTVIERS